MSDALRIVFEHKKLRHRLHAAWNRHQSETTRNDPKFSDRQVWANSVDPDRTAPSRAVGSGSAVFAILSAHCGGKPSFLNLKLNLGVRKFRTFTVLTSFW